MISEIKRLKLSREVPEVKSTHNKSSTKGSLSPGQDLLLFMELPPLMKWTLIYHSHNPLLSARSSAKKSIPNRIMQIYNHQVGNVYPQ